MGGYFQGIEERRQWYLVLKRNNVIERVKEGRRGRRGNTVTDK